MKTLLDIQQALFGVTLTFSRAPNGSWVAMLNGVYTMTHRQASAEGSSMKEAGEALVKKIRGEKIRHHARLDWVQVPEVLLLGDL